MESSQSLRIYLFIIFYTIYTSNALYYTNNILHYDEFIHCNYYMLWTYIIYSLFPNMFMICKNNFIYYFKCPSFVFGLYSIIKTTNICDNLNYTKLDNLFVLGYFQSLIDFIYIISYYMFVIRKPRIPVISSEGHYVAIPIPPDN